MRSLAVVEGHEIMTPFACDCLTPVPRIVDTADVHFERLKPLCDAVSVDILNPTVES